MGNLPLSKMDYESIKKLKQLNKNDLLDLIEGLSIYLKDRNFPIFEDVVDLLLNFNKELIPLINRIFEGEESDWKLNVLEYLLPQFPIGVLIELEVSLIKLVETPTTLDRELEVDMAAKEVLKNSGLRMEPTLSI